MIWDLREQQAQPRTGSVFISLFVFYPRAPEISQVQRSTKKKSQVQRLVTNLSRLLHKIGSGNYSRTLSFIYDIFCRSH